MNDIKAIIFDVGNTLVETKCGLKIQPQLLADLKTLREQGYKLGLSTLRTEEMIEPILKQFNFDFEVLANGSIVKIGNSTVFEKSFDKSEVSKILARCQKLNIESKLYKTNEKTYAIELISAKDKYQIDNDFQYYVWEISGNIDITPKNITKVTGLKCVCDFYNITNNNIMAFGDGFNDLEMLKFSGIGVAMGDSPEILKENADFVTLSVTENGISHALRRFKII